MTGRHRMLIQQSRRLHSRPLRCERLEDRALLAAIITVNSTDGGDERDDVLTLREAIQISNRIVAVSSLTAAEQAQVSGTPTATDTDTIAFDIAGDGIHTIIPEEEFPAITESVVIDGYTQPGGSPNTNAIDDSDPTKRGLNGTLLIEITGSETVSNGFTITADNSILRGLVINGFGDEGVVINGGNDNVVAGCYIGVDPTGLNIAPNRGNGILILGGASGNRIGTDSDEANDAAERNLISGNGEDGVAISGDGTSQNVVAGNLLGTDVTGEVAIGNSGNGVALFDGATFNTIGGSLSAARNIISGNLINGVAILGEGTSDNWIAGNYIGADVTGSAGLANKFRGVATGR